ncbi:ABC transporter ATP-binding protein [Fusibacter sp. 3D3]|uniref:ABC transporter ATP-binding protein n=1 Tax=Fusibacter sp. 3D3 TaxID=1048380 RepID=UPI000852C0F3|nr:dipeptide/oligopeptide/nickel ABC transporter ATP-binding protein [Fusibacter sp. 3D3]GAU76546.1 nickel transport ATP-binding protein NikE [Fusibacter sp. 3D3]
MIEVRDVYVSFKKENQSSLLGSDRNTVLKSISFSVPRGINLGILGESGSGKSTLGKVICGLLKPDSGQVTIDGNLLYQKGIRSKRKKTPMVSVVFQDYKSSTNPRMTVGDIILESLIRVEHFKDRSEYDKAIDSALERVNLSKDYKDRFPHELSGGQLQRVCIARALATQAKVIVFDEAVSALDAHTQVQIMDLLKHIQEALNLTYIFITHDLTSVTYFCDYVKFLYQGEFTESIEVSRLSEVRDVYAHKLLNAVL